MKRVVFIESRRQAAWARSAAGDAQLVALTAEARQSLLEFGVPHDPASAYADIHAMAAVDDKLNQDTLRLCQAIETFVGARHAPARFDGPGPLSGNAYAVQCSITAVVKRVLLMRGAVRHFAPDTVTTFVDSVDPWFAADGYPRDPWLEVIARDADAEGFTLECIRSPSSDADSDTALPRLRSVAGSLRRRVWRRLARGWRPSGRKLPPAGNLAGLNLLFISSAGFDWRPVIDRLKDAPGVRCFKATDLMLQPDQWWSTSLATALEPLTGAQPHDVGVAPIAFDQDALDAIGVVFDEWLAGDQSGAGMDVLGINVLPAIARQLRLMVCRSPYLIRYVDEVTRRFLDHVAPHAVCFFSLPLLVHQRVAYQCQQRQIPVVSYQHGFGYAVRVQPADEMCDPVFSDYFLMYGDGNRPRHNPAFAARAEYVSIGSARIEDMPGSRLQAKPSRRFRVLWVSEYSNQNTIGSYLTEETQRFDLYVACLKMLARAEDLDVTYRPYPGELDAIGRWLTRTPSLGVRIENGGPFADLAWRADIAIVATSSPTVWAEVLALKTPMVLYCDPGQTALTDAFMPDLERVCRWCRSGSSLTEAVRELSSDPRAYIAALSEIDTSAFLEAYVLHRGSCADRAISFLDTVCRHRRSVAEWEQAV